jgi:hypothetical protein
MFFSTGLTKVLYVWGIVVRGGGLSPPPLTTMRQFYVSSIEKNNTWFSVPDWVLVTATVMGWAIACTSDYYNRPV